MVAFNHIIGEYERQNNFDPIPKGTYKTKISLAEIKQNRQQTGNVLKLTFDIIAGDYEGRKIFENLNIKHPNADTVKIAYNNINGIGKAIGLSAVTDTNQLLNKPLMIDVGQKEEQGKVRNRIYGYESIAGFKHRMESEDMIPTYEINQPINNSDNSDIYKDDIPF